MVPADAEITWSSSDESAATVSPEGVVSNVNTGSSQVKVTITATAGDKTAECVVFCLSLIHIWERITEDPDEKESEEFHMSHTREEEWKQVRALHLVRDERDREVGAAAKGRAGDAVLAASQRFAAACLLREMCIRDSPCTAREAASKARTFPPGRGGKATGYKAVEKVHQGRDFFHSLSGGEDACPLRRLFVQEKIFFQAGLDLSLIHI